MKKLIAITLCAAMTLSFAGCSNNSNSKENSQKQTIGGEEVQIPSPFVDCDTMDEAATIAGFTIMLPERMPEGYTQKLIQAVENDMVQVSYENGEKKILIRKAKGSEDISGDYNEYKDNSTMTVGNLEVSTRGNDGKINTATWVDGEYTYAITTNLGETGLDENTIEDIVGSVR